MQLQDLIFKFVDLLAGGIHLVDHGSHAALQIGFGKQKAEDLYHPEDFSYRQTLHSLEKFIGIEIEVHHIFNLSPDGPLDFTEPGNAHVGGGKTSRLVAAACEVHGGPFHTGKDIAFVVVVDKFDGGRFMDAGQFIDLFDEHLRLLHNGVEFQVGFPGGGVNHGSKLETFGFEGGIPVNQAFGISHILASKGYLVVFSFIFIVIYHALRRSRGASYHIFHKGKRHADAMFVALLVGDREVERKSLLSHADIKIVGGGAARFLGTWRRQCHPF